MINKEILLRADKLTDEKYDFLEMKENQCKEDGEKFYIDLQENCWYTIKIAELQLIQEKLIYSLKGNK